MIKKYMYLAVGAPLAIAGVVALMSSAPETVQAKDSAYPGLIAPRKVENKSEPQDQGQKEKLRNTASAILAPAAKKVQDDNYNWRAQSRKETETMKRVKAYVSQLPGESFYEKFKLHNARDAREVLKVIGFPPERVTDDLIEAMRIRHMAALKGDIFHMSKETADQLSRLEEFDPMYWEKEKEYAKKYELDRKFLNSLRKFTHVKEDQAERMSYQASRKTYAKQILIRNENEIERLTDALLVADLGLDKNMRRYVISEIRAELTAMRDNLKTKSDYPLTVDLGRGVPKEVVKQKFEAYQVAIGRVNETLAMMDKKYPALVQKVPGAKKK